MAVQEMEADVNEQKRKLPVRVWECRNCGHTIVGTKAPEVCPVCVHPQSYYEIQKKNYQFQEE